MRANVLTKFKVILIIALKISNKILSTYLEQDLYFEQSTAVPLKKIQMNVDNFIWMRFIFGYTFMEHIHY